MKREERDDRDALVVGGLRMVGVALTPDDLLVRMPSFEDLMSQVEQLTPVERGRIVAEVDMAELGADAFALGVELFERGDFDRARSWLQRAARHGHAEAEEKVIELDELRLVLSDLQLDDDVDAEFDADLLSMDLEPDDDDEALAEAHRQAAQIIADAKRQAMVIITQARMITARHTVRSTSSDRGLDLEINTDGVTRVMQAKHSVIRAKLIEDDTWTHPITIAPGAPDDFYASLNRVMRTAVMRVVFLTPAISITGTPRQWYHMPDRSGYRLRADRPEGNLSRTYAASAIEQPMKIQIVGKGYVESSYFDALTCLTCCRQTPAGLRGALWTPLRFVGIPEEWQRFEQEGGLSVPDELVEKLREYALQ